MKNSEPITYNEFSQRHIQAWLEVQTWGRLLWLVWTRSRYRLRENWDLPLFLFFYFEEKNKYSRVCKCGTTRNVHIPFQMASTRQSGMLIMLYCSEQQNSKCATTTESLAKKCTGSSPRLSYHKGRRLFVFTMCSPSVQPHPPLLAYFMPQHLVCHCFLEQNMAPRWRRGTGCSPLNGTARLPPTASTASLTCWNKRKRARPLHLRMSTRNWPTSCAAPLSWCMFWSQIHRKLPVVTTLAFWRAKATSVRRRFESMCGTAPRNDGKWYKQSPRTRSSPWHGVDGTLVQDLKDAI